MNTRLLEYVAKVVAEAPPLTDLQRNQISAMLMPGYVSGSSGSYSYSDPEPPKRYPQFLYRHFDKCGHLLYVGITNAFTSRMNEHGRHSWWSKFSQTVEKTDLGTTDQSEAQGVEREAIANECPVFNTQHAGSGREGRIVKYLVEHDQWQHIAVGTQTGPTIAPLVRQLLAANADDAINWISGE